MKERPETCVTPCYPLVFQGDPWQPHKGAEGSKMVDNRYTPLSVGHQLSFHRNHPRNLTVCEGSPNRCLTYGKRAVKGFLGSFGKPGESIKRDFPDGVSHKKLDKGIPATFWTFSGFGGIALEPYFGHLSWPATIRRGWTRKVWQVYVKAAKCAKHLTCPRPRAASVTLKGWKTGKP